MRAVVQRVKSCEVRIIEPVPPEGGPARRIGPGLAVLLGVAEGDLPAAADKLAAKICSLRIFDDPEGKMNLSVEDVRGGVLVVSQFTLLADLRRGARPGFSAAAPPEKAAPLYRRFVEALETRLGRRVPTGEFGASMELELINDGPVTLILDTEAPG